MLEHSSYFEGQVQSVAYTRLGQKQSVGVIAAGDYHFGTAKAERMSVLSGELQVRRDGTDSYVTYPQGTVFEVPAGSGFHVRTAEASAYLCEYL